MNLGATELIIVLVIVLVVFGGAKLPKLARSIGQAQKEFQDGVSHAGILLLLGGMQLTQPKPFKILQQRL